MRNWTENRALRATLLRLKKIDDHLIEIGGLWGDVDQVIVNLADELRGRIEDAKKDVMESIEERASRKADEAEYGA